MKSIKSLMLLLFLICPLMGNAQEYSVGTSVAGIEPDQSLISLHLGGYGGPREGRFTIQWHDKGSLPAFSAISGVSDNLFILSNNNLLWRLVSDYNGEWIKAGKADNIISIAGINDKLYAVNNNGELFESGTGKIKWKKTSSADESVSSLAVFGNRLFAANARGDIWSANLSKGEYNWAKIIPLAGIVSLAANNEFLYALTEEGIIYKCKPGRDTRWLKAAYKNKLTVTEDIKHIAIAGNLMYGVDNNNVLYEGEHRSEGNLAAKAMAIRKGAEYGLGVKALWPGKMVSVAGYTNDVSSYLPTTLHIRAKNYEGYVSFFWYGMPNTFPEDVEKTILGTIKELSR